LNKLIRTIACIVLLYAQAEHTTIGQTARSAGARILPTDPSLSVEPSPAGPKQAQPANPN
jgi:hypothetical protein